HISTSGATEEIDMLVGAGYVDRLEVSWHGREILGLAHCFRRAIEKGIPQPIQIEDYSNFSMACRYLAGGLGIPFMPTKSLLGSDIAKRSTFLGEKKVKTIDCPFTGEKVALVPALNPDVTFVQAMRADREGNVQMWGCIADTAWALKASKKVVATVEEIVDNKIIRADPNRTVVPNFKVVAVVEAPYGGHPWHMQGYYDMDIEFRKMYGEASRNVETFEKFLDEWVYGVENHTGYLNKLGAERLLRLKAAHRPSSSVNYGY
ncbi:MAG: CoA-transferase, partial [Methanobacteriota archaeon]